MIRYACNRQMQPPAPFLHVSVKNPATVEALPQVPAQVDSAADRTVLPLAIVETLRLPQVGQTLIGGLGGTTHLLPAYVVLLGVHDLPQVPIKVIASADESWVLLGRDALNRHRVVLDGPQLALELG